MRRLLIISHHFPPSAASASFRMLGFAQHLPKFGWNSSVVACGPTPWEPIDQNLAAEIPENVTTRYVEFPLKRAQSPIPVLLQRMRLTDLYFVWNRPAFSACNDIVTSRTHHVILTSGPPHSVHLLGRKMKRRFGLPWVADFRDPWYSWGRDTPYTFKWRRVVRTVERSVVRAADLVLANSPNMRLALQSAYPGLHK